MAAAAILDFRNREFLFADSIWRITRSTYISSSCSTWPTAHVSSTMRTKCSKYCRSLISCSYYEIMNT